MKIAVLLRGQLRFCKEGSEFFKRYVNDRFPQHDFRIFYATWPTVSNTMDHPGQDQLQREFNIRTLDRETVLEQLRLWNPMLASIDIIQERLLMDFVRMCRELRLRDINTHYDFWDTTYGENLTAQFLMCPYRGQNIDVIMSETIRQHYLLGQIFGLGKSFDLLKQYREEQDWKPDIVWATRPDYVGWFENDEIDYFENMHVQLKARDNVGDYHNIIVDAMDTIDGRPVINDYNFYVTWENGLKTFGKTEEFLFDLFTKRRKIWSVVEAEQYLQHVLWTSVFSSKSIRWCKNSYAGGAVPNTIIRPVENLDSFIDEALNSPVSKDTMKKLIKNINTGFVYPTQTVEADKETIRRVYNQLMST